MAYYQVKWSLLPNLGFDLIGFALAQVVPVEVAGRIFLGLAFAIALSAPMALHRALYGRFSPLPLFVGVVIFNRTVQMGFLAYFLGVGLAIWAFAICLRCRHLHALARFALLQVASLTIFIVHLYAAAIFAILVLVQAASEGWRTGSSLDGMSTRLKSAYQHALPPASAFVLPFALLLASKTGNAGTGFEYEPFLLKLVMIPMSQMLDVSTPGLALAELVLLPSVLARLGRARMLHPDIV